MRESLVRGAATFLLLLIVSSAAADILFDPGKNLIIVENFASAAPCTVTALRLTARLNGWEFVRYDPTGDVATVNADLQIGQMDGEESFFQIGTDEHPGETLLLNGNLAVCPAMICGRASRRVREKGLSIGSQDDPKIGGTLKLGEDKVLYIGYLDEYAGWATGGGGLRIHNGSILPADPSRRWSRKFSRISPLAYIVLRNATIAGFNDSLYGFMPNPVYRKTPEDFTVQGCTFADGESVIFGTATVRGCVFRNLDRAVLDYGGLDATFENCVFKGNRCNFDLRYHRGVTCIDCEIDAPERAWFSKSRDPATGKAIYPRLVSKRTIRVKVTDDAGQPVAGATVTARARNPESDPSLDPESSDRRTGVTGGDGLTTADAILLTEQLRQATDTNGVVRTVDYLYDVAAASKEKRGAISGYRPRAGDTVTVALKE
jgi:hypothetical protein